MDIDDIKLIPEFMGIHVLEGVNEFAGGRKYYYYNNPELEDYDALPDYKGSWDDLMPVVEKIQDMGYLVHMNNVSTNINNNGGGTKLKKYFKGGYNSSHGNMKRRTYKAVVEFIKWYNENK